MSLTIDDLTKGEVGGTGTFDRMMLAITAHLDKQYNESKITGSDYATVYLGALTTVMQQATAYLLGAERLEKELLLIQEQIDNMQKQTALVEAQIANINADTLIKTEQIQLTANQAAQVIEQTKLTTSQKNQVDKEIELLTQQVLKAMQDTALVAQQVINTTNQNTTITKQQEKLDAENAILLEKLETEQAQTKGTTATVSGLIGKQMLLIDKQAEGFDRNAEQKLAKIMVDTWTVRQTTDGADVAANGLSDNEINKILNIAKTGIGSTPFNG